MQPVTTRARTRDPIRRTSESQMPAAHTPHPTATSRGVPAQVPPTLPPRTRDRLTSSQRTPPSTDAPEPAQPVPKVPLSRPYSPPPRALPGRVPTPVFPFPRPPKGILKKQPLPFDVPLHRYIIPYNTELYGEDQKLLYWDVSMLPDNVRDYHASVALGRRELDTRFASKLGTNFTRMIIDCPRIKDCYIEVNNEKGITCRDIFKAIYLKFKAKLTEEEKMFYFRETGKLYETRLEMLNGVTVFMGIRPSAVYNTSWELILGRDPDEGKNKIFVGQTQ
ncbi:hypothetical protein QCA50_006810 [Cerrena zonata]|uniref:DUF6699 domain-containing protein n=1 Tax=Cerrena zonata TaxID=2478898 RepID=A0AAW0GBB1_9APHY